MESRFVQARDLRVHYLEAGRGEPLLLLHGWPQTSEAWRRLAPMLATNYHVIAPDMRGLGGTTHVDGDDAVLTDADFTREHLAADVLALMDALRLDSATLIGHDWGGTLAAKVAFEAPARVQRLLLLDSVNTGWPATVGHFHWFADGDRAERLFAARGEDLVNAIVGGLPCGLPRPPECPLEFTAPAYATRWPFAAADELAAYARAFATPLGRRALIAPLRTLRFHRVLPDAAAPHGERYEALPPETVAAMWRNGRAGREYLDFAPQDRHRQYTGAVQWLYGQYLLDYVHGFMDDEGLPAGDPALESFQRHFPRVEARGIDAGHYFIEEKPEVTAQLMRRFLKKN